MTTSTAEISPPCNLLFFTEAQRLAVEASSLLSLLPLLRATSPKGDGTPVMLLPGFMADDSSLVPMRRFLNDLGYQAFAWGMGRNVPNDDLEQRLYETFDNIRHQYSQPISLIGQSLGGVFAREIARRFPESVRQVVTLGSPFRSVGGPGTHPVLVRLGNAAIDGGVDDTAGDAARFVPPTGVPTTAVYSRQDGVVSWRICVEDHHISTENVRIFGSHCGMAMNPMVYRVLADRLSRGGIRAKPAA